MDSIPSHSGPHAAAPGHDMWALKGMLTYLYFLGIFSSLHLHPNCPGEVAMVTGNRLDTVSCTAPLVFTSWICYKYTSVLSYSGESFFKSPAPEVPKMTRHCVHKDRLSALV